MTDVDRLSPTQQLVLDVLAARQRLGEQVWTFSTSVGPALRALESARLVTLMNGIVENSIRARLTEAGKRLAVADGYRPPNGGIERLRGALTEITEFAAARTETSIGMGTIAAHARRALEGAVE